MFVWCPIPFWNSLELFKLYDPGILLLLVGGGLLFCFLNSIIYWSILVEICFIWSESYSLFLLLVGSILKLLYKIIDPLLLSFLSDPKDEVCTVEFPIFEALPRFIDEFRLPRLNSKDLSSYFPLLVDIFEAELGSYIDEFFLFGKSLKSYLLNITSSPFSATCCVGALMSLFLFASTREEIMLLTFIESLFLAEYYLLVCLCLPYGT